MKNNILNYISNLEKCSYIKSTFYRLLYYELSNYSKIDISRYLDKLIKESIIQEISLEGFELVSLDTKKLNRLRKIYKLKKTDV
jgi:hypothetical protein